MNPPPKSETEEQDEEIGQEPDGTFYCRACGKDLVDCHGHPDEPSPPVASPLANIMSSLWRNAEDQVLELAKALQTIAEEPIRWTEMSHHYYAKIAGRFQLIAHDALHANPPVASPSGGETPEKVIQELARDASRHVPLNCEPSGAPLLNGLKPVVSSVEGHARSEGSLISEPVGTHRGAGRSAAENAEPRAGTQALPHAAALEQAQREKEGYKQSLINQSRVEHELIGKLTEAQVTIAGLLELLRDLLDVWDPEWEPGKSLHTRAVADLRREG